MDRASIAVGAGLVGYEPKPNRKAVLGGWLDLIEQRTGTRLRTGDVGSISYQIIHRAASACATSERPQLAYLQFVTATPGTTAHRADDLERLYSALGRPRSFCIRLVEIKLDPTEAFEALASLDREILPRVLQRRLQSEPLFHLRSYRLTTLAGPTAD